MPFILGIAGGTASGKSTLARKLVQQIGPKAGHIVHDRYYKGLPDAFKDNPADYNFDHPDALDTALLVQHLHALKAEQGIDLPNYLFERSERAGHTDHMSPRPIFIVEGILVLAEPALRACFDHSVFIDTPDDIRLIRRLRRDTADRGRSFHHVLNQYEATVRPMHEAFVKPSRAHAQTVISGIGPLAPKLQQLMDLLPL